MEDGRLAKTTDQPVDPASKPVDPASKPVDPASKPVDTATSQSGSLAADQPVGKVSNSSKPEPAETTEAIASKLVDGEHGEERFRFAALTF
jgi:hypothetical protein